MIEKAFSFYGNAEAKSLHLCIECGEQHLAFWSEKNSERKTIVSFELFYFEGKTSSFKDFFEKIRLQSGILNHKYNAVTIIWENSFCVCIPQQYFSSGMLDSYIDYTGAASNTSGSLYTYNNGFSVAYKTDREQYKVLMQHFPTAIHIHKYNSFAKAASSVNNGHPLLIYVAMFHNYYIISAFNNGQLQFINRLQYDSIPETVTAIEDAAKQLSWHAANTMLIVSGLIDEQSALFNQLAKHFAQVKMDDTGEYSFEHDAEALPHSPHYYLPYFKFNA